MLLIIILHYSLKNNINIKSKIKNIEFCKLNKKI